MQPTPINKVQENLTEWTTALTTAFDKAGYSISFHPLTGGGHRVGILSVSKPEHSDIRYKIEFERKLIVQNNERVVICGIEVFNPNGNLHVHMKGFSEKKVAKIVDYADKYISSKIASDQRTEARRLRKRKAAEIFDAAMQGFEMPHWASALSNVETDEDVGTYTLSFYEQRDSYSMKRLTPQQIKKIINFIQTVVNEPTVAEPEKELATHKDLKYDRKADDRQWMDLTNNP